MLGQPSIREADSRDAELVARLIRESFKDVAARFALTPANCPKHPSNCMTSWVEADQRRGVRDWYLRLGFMEVETKSFPHLPFRVTFLNFPTEGAAANVIST